jgi:nitrogen regulatory protein P-II 1
MSNIKVLFIIVNAGYAEDVMDVVRSCNAGGATIINARGGGAHPETILGITIDAEKEIIFSVVDNQKAEKIADELAKIEEWKSKMHGICFTLPVDKTIGINI